MDAADQLDQAVMLALGGSDADIKARALEFVTQVQAEANSWLAPCLEIVLSANRPDQTQFFALQIIERTISSSQDLQSLNNIRSKLWLLATSNSAAPRHFRNKLANVLGTLFTRLYPEEWPSFFTDLLQLVAQYPENSGELYVNVLLSVHEKIGDQLFAREAEEMQRANWLKDMVRERDAVRLAQSWGQLLGGGAANDAVIDGILRVMSGWVVWTDVALISPTVPLIEKQMANPATKNSAVLCLAEIIAKKMAPDLKLELLRGTNVIAALKSCSRDSPEFVELLAKLVNGVLFEAAHALNELPLADASSVTQGLDLVIADLFPLVLEFLGNEFDDTSLQLVPGITEFLTFLRREARHGNKKVSIGGSLSSERTQKLRLLLDCLVAKSRYDPNDYVLGDVDTDEDEGGAEFDEFRAKLRVLQEQLAQIDTRLFLDVIGSFVSASLTSNASGGSGQVGADAGESWTNLELALYELSVYNDVARQWAGKASKCGAEMVGLTSEVQQAQFMLFGQMVVAGGSSPAWSHPANRMWYMELVHRQAPQFLVDSKQENRNLLSEAFQFFLKHGIQSTELNVRVRSWYMFYRFLRAVRRSPILSNPSLGPSVFSVVARFLPVHIAPPATEDLSIAVQQDTTFTSQLYLYELCGILFAVGQDTTTSADLMRQLLATMFADIDAATNGVATPGPLEHIRIHHNIVALSSFTKGLTETALDLSSGSLNGLVSQLQTATQMVVAVLERLHGVQIIRDACRQCFARMLGFLGEKIIMEISSFINVLLQTSSPADLGDFLSFLGQLSHQFEKNSQIFEMFASLTVPLLEKVFHTLQQVAQTADVEAEGSTDAQLFRRDVVASYLQLLYNMLNNKYGAMLFIENNAPVLDNVFQSLMHYSRNGDVKGGAGSAANQKMAVVVLTKMASMWGRTGKVEAPNFGADLVVPLFSESSTYETLTELCWSLPADQSVSFSDAQSRMVISELAGLQQVMWEVRGSEYQSHIVQYLTSAGLDNAAIEEFVHKLSALPKEFKRFYVQFLQKALAK